MTAEALLVWCPFPDLATARHAAAMLIPQGLAACVHLFPAGESHYLWQGKLTQGLEIMTLWKTTPARWNALSTELAALHPYEVPAIFATPVSALPPACLSWLQAACSSLSE